MANILYPNRCAWALKLPPKYKEDMISQYWVITHFSCILGQVNGRGRFSTLHSSETLRPIFMKFKINNYFPDTTPHAKFQRPMSTWVVWANSQFDAWKFLSFFPFFITPQAVERQNVRRLRSLDRKSAVGVGPPEKASKYECCCKQSSFSLYVLAAMSAPCPVKQLVNK